MTVLITGATGFIGRRLVDALLPTEEVIGTTHELDHLRQEKGLDWIRWDIRNPAAPQAFPDHLDAVVHLAQTRDYRSFPELALEITRVNLDGLINVLEAARAAQTRRFVLASSGGVYAPGPGIRTEADPPQPQSFYQATKLAGEVLASRYNEYFSVVCLRIFFAYGPGQAHDRFIPDLVRRVATGKPVQVRGVDGFQANPIHVDDVARSFHRALKLEGSHLINVAGPDVLSLRRIVELIGFNVGRTPVVEHLQEDVQSDLIASTLEMTRCLGAPSIRFQDRIAEVCAEVSGALT
jgi:nucleoside-diphosphate-sugar epimerase